MRNISICLFLNLLMPLIGSSEEVLGPYKAKDIMVIQTFPTSFAIFLRGELVAYQRHFKNQADFDQKLKNITDKCNNPQNVVSIFISDDKKHATVELDNSGKPTIRHEPSLKGPRPLPPTLESASKEEHDSYLRILQAISVTLQKNNYQYYEAAPEIFRNPYNHQKALTE